MRHWAPRQRHKPIGSTNCLVNAACDPARQACARLSVDTRMASARAKPTPLGNGACRHGRGPLGRAGLATQRDVRGSGCVCIAQRAHGFQLWVANRRICELAFGAAGFPTRQRRPDITARRPDHRRCVLPSVEAWRSALATQRGSLSNDVACCARRQHGRQLRGVRTCAFAGLCVEQLIEPFGRVVSARPTTFNSMVLRLLSCEQRNCQL